MKQTLVLFLILGAVAAAPAQKVADKKTAPAKKAVPQKSNAMTVPSDAVLVEPGRWKHTDAKGKIWMYRESPFGIVRYEPEAVSVVAAADTGMTVVEEGDSVRFTKPSPFGPRTWTRKKAELEGDELLTWNKFLEEKAAAAAAAPVGNAKPASGK